MDQEGCRWIIFDDRESDDCLAAAQIVVQQDNRAELHNVSCTKNSVTLLKHVLNTAEYVAYSAGARLLKCFAPVDAEILVTALETCGYHDIGGEMIYPKDSQVPGYMCASYSKALGDNSLTINQPDCSNDDQFEFVVEADNPAMNALVSDLFEALHKEKENELHAT